MVATEVVIPKPTLDSQISALSENDGAAAKEEGNKKESQKLSSALTTATNKSSITYGGQGELPPLPIPSLDETLQRFMQNIEALQGTCTPEEREEYKQVVLDFMKNEGPQLQEALLEYDRAGRECGEIGSYVEEFWNDSYLAPDSSVVMNLNPFFVLEDSPDPKTARDPIKRAASLCFASVRLASQLRYEKLRPDTIKGKPLCMDQFKALFGASRVPNRTEKDAIHVFDKSNHVAVMCGSLVYYFQALWPDGHVAVDEGDLVDILTAIKAHAKEEYAASNPIDFTRQSIGVLTSLPRKDWAIAREQLMQESVTNQESLQVIDSALFVLALDDYIPKDKHDAAANMLHGSYVLEHYQPPSLNPAAGDSNSPEYLYGYSTASSSTEIDPSMDYQAGSCCNRWYDKIQIIVCGDGTAGVNFEHSAIDGHTALRFVSDVYAETVISFAQSITKLVATHDIIPNVIHAKVKRAAVTLDKEGRTTLDVFPKLLQFDISEKMQRRIYHAETALGDEIVASETCVLEFQEYGKNFIVRNKCSPDSFVQMSMMLAYYRLYGRIVGAYEPVLTKGFYHGRTEAMRPATVEAKRLCEIFEDPDSSNEEKIEALRTAAKMHSTLVRECARGKGVDRHLFALRCIADRKGMKTPAFFKSTPYNMLNHTVLSTSNCGNPALSGFGFGPVVADGLGIGYIIKDHSLNYSISSKHRQTRRYAYNLEGVLKDLAKLFASEAKVTRVQAPPTRRRSLSPSERKQLKSMPVDMIAYDTYGDNWGESTPNHSRRASGTGASSDYQNGLTPTKEAELQERLRAAESSQRQYATHRRHAQGVGPVEHKRSFQYKDLSQKGKAIAMEKQN